MRLAYALDVVDRLNESSSMPCYSMMQHGAYQALRDSNFYYPPFTQFQSYTNINRCFREVIQLTSQIPHILEVPPVGMTAMHHAPPHTSIARTPQEVHAKMRVSRLNYQTSWEHTSRYCSAANALTYHFIECLPYNLLVYAYANFQNSNIYSIFLEIDTAQEATLECGYQTNLS